VFKFNGVTNSEGFLARYAETVVFLNNKKQLEAKQRILLNFECNNQTFFIKKNLNENYLANLGSPEMPWFVVKQFKPLNDTNV
jgi:hypothetical protein